MKLTDGTGTSRKGKIDSNNALVTQATNITRAQKAGELGHRYMFGNAGINKFNFAETAILYVKNNEIYDLNIERVDFYKGDLAGSFTAPSQGDVVYKIYKNPTGGTIISSATAPSYNSNMNTSSNNVLDADIYNGLDSSTNVGGIVIWNGYAAPNENRFSVALENFIITSGDSITITVDLAPPATGFAVQYIGATMIAYLATPEVKGE